MSQLNYKQVVSWDASVIDVGFLGSEQSVPLALRGLASEGTYIVTGAPAATAGQWIPGATITNAVDGTLYLNTGTTASPVWSLLENSGDVPIDSLAYNSDATAGPLTIAAAKMVNALLDRDGGATNRADTTTTAALLLAAIPGAAIGTTFTFYYRNISTTAGERAVLSGGSGVTISGNAEVVSGQTQVYVARFTNVTVAAVTLYAVGGVAGVLSQTIAASTVNSLKATTSATTAPVLLAPVGSDTNIGLSIDGKGSGQTAVGGTSTGLVRVGQGSAKQTIQGGAVASLGTTQNSTPTAAQLLGGIVTQTGATGAGTVTLPLGTDMDTAVPNGAVGDSFRVRFANLGGGQTLTITGASGFTVVGTATVATATNIDLLCVKTGTGTWVAYTNK